MVVMFESGITLAVEHTRIKRDNTTKSDGYCIVSRDTSSQPVLDTCHDTGSTFRMKRNFMADKARQGKIYQNYPTISLLESHASFTKPFVAYLGHWTVPLHNRSSVFL